MNNPSSSSAVFSVTRRLAGGIILFGWLAICLPCSSATALDGSEVRIGVLSWQGEAATIEDWQPTADYLTRHLPDYRFTVIPLSFEALHQRAIEGTVDFLVLNGASYVDLHTNHGSVAMATQFSRVGEYRTKHFGTVIFTRADRDDITGVQDLEGCTLIAISPMAWGGWLAGRYTIENAGVSLEDLAGTEFTGFPVDRVVEGVLAGEADAGVVRADVLPRLKDEGVIQEGDVKVLDPVVWDGYAFPTTTPLYPNPVFAYMPHVPLDLVRSVTAHLLRIDEESGDAEGLGQWIPPVSYESVRQALEDMRAPPYDRVRSLSLGEVVREYKSLFLAVGLVALASVIIILNHRRLVERVYRRTRIQLEAQRDQMMAAAESSRIVLWALDLKTGELQISPGWKALLGFDKGEVSDDLREWKSLVHPDDVSELMVTENRLRNGIIDESEHTCRFRSGDQSYRWLLTKTRLFRDEKGLPAMILGTHFDMTRIALEKHALEQAVEERTKALGVTESRFRTVADYTFDWQTWIDESGLVVYCSPAIERISGYSREEYIRDPALAWKMAHPDDIERVRRHYSDHDAEGSTENLTYRIRTRDGQTRWVEHACQAVTDPDGRFIGRRGSNRDITDRIQILEELQQARDAAEASANAKASFLANMSHEIRTPMNAVIGMTHVMMQEGVSRHQHDQLEKIQNAGTHLLNIINDILDLSKIDQAKLELEELRFNPCDLIGKTKLMFEEQSLSKGIELAFDIDFSESLLIGDPTRISQVLINLVGNAVKFTERGSVTVRGRCEKTGTGRADLCFEVADTGIGISSERLESLFGVFDQADSSITRRYGGSGLGLALSERLVKAMGGELQADSEPGKGSRFWFRLPLLTSSSAPQSERLEDRGAALRSIRERHSGRRILLVEDDRINQEVARSLLAQAELTVTVAENGLFAEEMATTDPLPDLILMDVQMPVVDGLEATRRIRRHEGCEKLPVIAMTANAFAEDRANCLAAGMDDFIAKPVEPERFYSTVLYWLEHDEPRHGPA